MSKITWYVNRLRSMSVGEITHRLGENVRIKAEKMSLAKESRGEKDGWIPAGAYLSFTFEEDSCYFWKWEERETIVETLAALFPEGRQATLQTADELLEHRFRIFQQIFDLPEEINWHMDPLTGKEWPQRFWAEIDTRDGQAIGGVKWVWELNRHHHLVTLGKAYFITRDERYAAEVCRQMVAWIDANPFRIGIHWTSPLELALRMINWSCALMFIRRSLSFKADAYTRVLTSIDQHCRQIAAHLSAYSSANNHLIGEAAGLAVIGLLFPCLPQATHWKRLGMQILSREVEKQIGVDGVPAEQALHYLVFDLDFYLIVGLLARLNNEEIPVVWTDRMNAACEFIALVMDGQGNVPGIGDSDDAWVLRLDDRPEVNNYASILASTAAFLGVTQKWTPNLTWDEKSHWLLGEQGRKHVISLPASGRNMNSACLKTGGYAVMRAEGRVIVFDIGGLGYLSTAAHGHADALSLWLALDGQEVLVDSGTFAYQEAGVWREYFRSTRAHNTLVVDDINQSQMMGTFLWGVKAQAHLHYWVSTPEYDCVIASQDGYRAIQVSHQRTIVYLKPDTLFIIDDVIGSGNHTLAQYWHLPHNVRVEQKRKFIRASAGLITVDFYNLTEISGKANIQQGSEKPIQGWVSPRYGVKYPAPVIEYTHQGSLPVKLGTAIDLSPFQEVEKFASRRDRFLKIYKNLPKVTQ